MFTALHYIMYLYQRSKQGETELHWSAYYIYGLIGGAASAPKCLMCNCWQSPDVHDQNQDSSLLCLCGWVVLLNFQWGASTKLFLSWRWSLFHLVKPHTSFHPFISVGSTWMPPETEPQLPKTHGKTLVYDESLLLSLFHFNRKTLPSVVSVCSTTVQRGEEGGETTSTLLNRDLLLPLNFSTRITPCQALQLQGYGFLPCPPQGCEPCGCRGRGFSQELGAGSVGRVCRGRGGNPLSCFSAWAPDLGLNWDGGGTLCAPSTWAGKTGYATGTVSPWQLVSPAPPSVLPRADR